MDNFGNLYKKPQNDTLIYRQKDEKWYNKKVMIEKYGMLLPEWPKGVYSNYERAEKSVSGSDIGFTIWAEYDCTDFHVYDVWSLAGEEI